MPSTTLNRRVGARKATRKPIKSLKSRKPWEPSELKTLISMAKKHVGAPRIAKALHRTESSVRQQAVAQKISLAMRKAA